ncbi:MAG: hypothetical protein IJ855_07480, partial [Bacteroidales bacterium]|nr:hypothetical protein [Bacteroidales bacterium]
QGKAGSGKSYMIRELVSQTRGAIILVPTNMAKSVYNNAQTIHSFFTVNLMTLKTDIKIPGNTHQAVTVIMDISLIS